MIIIIGFEYICNLYNVKYIEVAGELDISKQTINSWVSGRRRIPDKHLPKLSEKFKLSQEYFKKELNYLDKVQIQRMKIENEMVEIEYGDTIIDDETGEEYPIIKTALISGEEDCLKHLTYEIKKKELYEKIKRTFDNCSNNDGNSMDGESSDAWILLENFQKFSDLMDREKINKNTVKKILRAISMACGKGFGGDSFTRKIIDAIQKEDIKIERK